MRTLKSEEEQRDLWRTLAIGHKNKIPLLLWVIDSFIRDRLNYYIKHHRILQLSQWVLNFPTLKILSKLTTRQQVIQSAMQIFFHRYSGMIQLPVYEKYNDSIKAFIDYIVEATNFIRKILDNDNIEPPFQV